MSASPIRVAVSTVIFSLRSRPEADTLMIPLVRRTRDPFAGAWALPGGWLDESEGLDDAASRTLAETTALSPSYLEQLYAFGDVDRSPTRVVSVVYWALLRSDLVDAQRATEDAPENVEWFDVDDLPPLAFDHNRIVEYALWRLRNKVGYSRIAHGLLPDEFTLTELREVYEAVLGRRLDPSNFRRLLEGSEALLPTESFRTGKHRPARLYRYNSEVALADRGPLERRRSLP
ncbi:NUDIX domain-containing protein [Microbacterium oryzae]|uniref:NUDIX hydrolase n=1 Tax=Microbacterium oryzae TaxID=743009 RepID=UPI0025AF9BC4|nr:NUDIX domain-containing protein [Microbacterium oryzae]MDN3309716.1 NUDIX domain-containing protein [Microbacterium oryzae]